MHSILLCFPISVGIFFFFISNISVFFSFFSLCAWDSCIDGFNHFIFFACHKTYHDTAHVFDIPIDFSWIFISSLAISLLFWVFCWTLCCIVLYLGSATVSVSTYQNQIVHLSSIKKIDSTLSVELMLR